MTENLIDLGLLTRGGEVHNLSGHERGVAARESFNLDAFDAVKARVRIKVPDDIYSLTPSFFQGMFAETIHGEGDQKESFLARYNFDADAVIQRQIERGISAVLTRRSTNAVS
jgi:hypothetical protein